MELARKLAAGGFGQVDIADAIADLQTRGLLSDERFAEEYVRSRQRRGSGPLRILAELSGKGIDRQLAASVVDLENPRWLELGREARQKRFGARLPAEAADKARQTRFLAQRGFGSGQIRQILADDER